MDASRHGPKKGGPMGSTIGPFKYYVIHYQTLFKHFRAAGPNGPCLGWHFSPWAGTARSVNIFVLKRVVPKRVVLRRARAGQGRAARLATYNIYNC